MRYTLNRDGDTDRSPFGRTHRPYNSRIVKQAELRLNGLQKAQALVDG